MEHIKEGATKGEWFVEMSDLTIRCKNFDDSNCMGDYRGNIIADLKPSLGIVDWDVDHKCLDINNPLSYPNGGGGRQHAWNEVIANANSICNVMNKIRGL